VKENQIIIYNTEDGSTKIDLKVSDETVWLNQMELAELFQTTKNNISLHIKNIFESGELDIISTVKDYSKKTIWDLILSKATSQLKLR